MDKAKQLGCFDYGEVQHFFKKLRPRAWLSASLLQVIKTKVCGLKTGDRVVASRLIQSIVKYGTSVMLSGKQIAAVNCRTEIIINTGIGLRNKTMADSHRLFWNKIYKPAG